MSFDRDRDQSMREGLINRDERDYNHHDGGMSSSKKLLKIGTVVVVVLLLIGIFGMSSFLVSRELKRGDSDSSSSSGKSNYLPSFLQMTKDAANMMDPSADPCQDFYQFACGGFVAKTPLPADDDMYIPTFDIIQQRNMAILRDIIDGQWPLISDLFQSCLTNVETPSPDKTHVTSDLLDRIASLRTNDDAHVLTLVALFHSMDIETFFQPVKVEYDENDPADPPIYHLSFAAGGFTNSVDYDSPEARAALAQTIVDSYLLAFFPDYNTTYAEAVAKTIVDVEAGLYLLNLNSNPIKVNMSYADFEALVGTAHLNPRAYFDGLGLTPGVLLYNSTVFVSSPEFFQGLGDVLHNASLDVIRSYLGWRVYYEVFNPMPPSSSSGDSLFSRVPHTRRIATHSSISVKDILREMLHQEQADDPTPEDVCIDGVEKLLGDYVGLLFSLRLIDDATRYAVLNMTAGIADAFAGGLDDLKWITAASKQAALDKLRHIIPVVGHPNRLERYAGVGLSSTSLFGNIITLIRANFADQMSLVETPFVRADFEFSAIIVNAFYSPDTNTINFPAGILESPMFSTLLPVMFQYARMGYVVGHETTHGFDNNGRMWGPTGRPDDWMDETSASHFDERAQCLAQQYSRYSVDVDGQKVYVNGNQTLGENIADLGGAKNAHRAYQAWVKAHGPEFGDEDIRKLVKGLTSDDQLFWVLLGQTWCTVTTPEAVAQQIERDVHSPSTFRVNGPLSNIDDFANAFKCPVGSPMNPKDKCLIW